MKTTTPEMSPWEYYNVNKNAYGYLYQIGASLGKPFQFVSFDGPFKGSAADVSIIRSTLVPQLEKDEIIMCDKGYRHESRCWCPPEGNIGSMCAEDKAKRREVTKIRQLNERVIGRLVLWGVFKRKWSQGWRFHKLCAHVAARITQLELHAYPLT